MKNGSSGCGKNKDCEYHHPKMCRYESKCNSIQCKYLHPKNRQQTIPTLVKDQTNVTTVPIQAQGTQSGGNTVVSTIPTSTNTTNNSTTTTASNPTIATATVATTTTSNSPNIATVNQSENPQVFHKITTGPDITQILVGLQSAIQTLTNDIKELNKQQQQLQQQQQQHHQQWTPQVFYSQ